MLFRRFSLVTTCIALFGILVSNMIEATQTSRGLNARGFAVEERLKAWEAHDAKTACMNDQRLCIKVIADEKLV